MLSAHQAELAFVLFIHYSEHFATRAAYAFMLYSCPHHHWLNHPSLYLGGSVNEAQGTGRHSVARWIFVLFENTVQWVETPGTAGIIFSSAAAVCGGRITFSSARGKKEEDCSLPKRLFTICSANNRGEEAGTHMQNWILKWIKSQHSQKLLDCATRHILYLKLGWPNQFRVRAWWGWEL